MVKWFSMLFALLLLLQSSKIGIGDVLRLDDLISHAQFHDEHHGDSLVDFFSKHYGELKEAHNAAHKHEQSEHEQLPFNHGHCTHHSTVLAFIFSSFKEDVKQVQLVELTETNFFYSAPSSTAHTMGLLQPPRYS
jgi:hypothetical protein